MPTVQQWIGAIRPKTLPTAMAPVAVGGAIAWKLGAWNGGLWAWIMISSLLLQIAVNLANDYDDAINGTDTPRRVGPTRLTASGAISPPRMRMIVWGSIALATASGVGLIGVGGWPILLIGIASIAAIRGYSGGKKPYSHRGLADGVVWLFFGPIACQGTVWVMAHSLSVTALLLGAALGLVAVAVLVLNHLRDETEDRLTGKHTLVVRWGTQFGIWEYRLCLLVACLLLLGMAWLGRHWVLLGVALVLLPTALRLMAQLTQSNVDYTHLLGQTARFGLAMAFGCALSIVAPTATLGEADSFVMLDYQEGKL